MSITEGALREAQRTFSICNGCRYCEGYCAVFPAMERRVIFTEGDVAYLANLCHDCRACYQACMYTPPHEFAVDIPSLLSHGRVAAYRRFAWPTALVRAFDRGPLGLLLLTLLGAVAAALGALAAGRLSSPAAAGPGAFYRVVPYGVMAGSGLVLGAYVVLVLAVGFVRFWIATGTPLRRLLAPSLWMAVAGDAASLRFQRGGGDGCYYESDDRASDTRRRMHQAVVLGFLLDFASTTLAAFCQDILGQMPPFPLWHPVVVLGTAGGLLMVAGATRLLLLRLRSTGHADADEVRLSLAFLVALLGASISGLALLAVRSTGLMPALLVAHLGSLAVLYLAAPYGKFAHWPYRVGALLKLHLEERQASREAAHEAA